MTVQRWALVPADAALPVRVFDDQEAARRAAAWCPGRIVRALDEDALDARHRAHVQATLVTGTVR
ncbi:hypothetical protein [Methylorubrum extorquens]|uniref:Uncharacterized protein n=1 Tax=Methylorubrum extorquens DSM 13060 TaxID=882800 RepID=H1KVU7_METEX|nr:hypothetical protein [Methylorubrum extorquens]EHP71826.1 hypothetical protein MetexDRAFT_6760 [Methylorubrum extorquens DSM 13060]